MKNIISRLVLVAVFATSVFSAAAQNYKHSAGIVVGTMEGLSYKGFIGENLALQADLAWKVIPTVGTTNIALKLNGETLVSESYSGSTTFWTFETNPNLLYQNRIMDFNKCTLYGYAGGGVSLGFGRNFDAGQDISVAGKWGVNAIGGLELAFDIPLALFFDFRPGYGMAFDTEVERVDGVRTSATLTTHFFDWGLGIGARLCF